MGDVVDGRSHRRHCSRCSQSAEYQSRACHLHLRDNLRYLGRRLSLFGLDSETTDPRLLAARLAVVPRAWRLSQSRSHCFPRRNTLALADLHRKALAVAMGHASVDFLGMPASGCDYLSARIRVDLFHE